MDARAEPDGLTFDAFAFVLLRRGPNADAFTEEELARLQEQHLEHLRTMTAAGKLVAAGPFRDQPDETLRGLCLYACGVDEARELAARDPSVQAGRMAVEVMTLLTEAGTVRFSREA